jgi:hypothetical protein
MESSFDLDINNYTTNDLLNFFKLDGNYSLEDLALKEEKLATDILSIHNKKYNSKYKFDIINFIKLGKDILTSFYHDMESNKEMKKNIDRFVNKDKDPRVGKIINPLAPHQTLEHMIIPKESINGYNYDVTTSIYVFNTATRNDFYTSKSSNSIYDLPIKWKNVISVSLAAVTIPNVMYAFSKESGTNQLYIEEDSTGLSGIVTIPDGNYSPYEFNPLIAPSLTESSFPQLLTKYINEQILGIINPILYRFIVTIDLANRKTTISNTTNTFMMITINKNPNDICSPNGSRYDIDYGVDPPPVSSLPIQTYIYTLGYAMGFREIKYQGATSYISESIFTNKYSDYLYFALDDYTGSQTITNTYGMLGSNGLLSNNILGVIPISSDTFSPTFDNNANFIYKKREYFGPVDISRISIKLLNQRGNVVNVYDTNFNFTLQIKTIYNLTENSKMNLRGTGFL